MVSRRLASLPWPIIDGVIQKRFGGFHIHHLNPNFRGVKCIGLYDNELGIHLVFRNPIVFILLLSSLLNEKIPMVLFRPSMNCGGEELTFRC